MLNTGKILTAAAGTDPCSNVYRLAFLARAEENVTVDVAASFEAVHNGDHGRITFSELDVAANPKTGKPGKTYLGFTLLPVASSALLEAHDTGPMPTHVNG